MPKPTTKTPVRRELVMNQLMEAAERLFAQKGVAGTSLQELADAVGLTRTAIYHYIRGKEDILETLVEGFTLRTARDLRRLAASNTGSAMDRLREAVTGMALIVAQHPQRFRLLLTSEGAFPEPLAKQYRRARRETLAALEELMVQAIKEGSCRPVDPELAAFALVGVSNWVAFWYPRPEGAGAAEPERLAASLADIALQGVLSERTASGDGVAHVIGLLRDDLGRLERMLEGS
ncbi:TetR/AcrR family transcriptional regulator [Streptomyces sp. SID13031]|uniref:TetR/AcrR family transcriptional regulator n=1 Tax=Streptomyces sp. SID13031 TaxID=2706046 RepID=UPI0013CCC4D8|nr:TetR/AcrR family transcriptional regulator [Streptomyces sp. SID13031]NEA31332.1 TetR/AcrR family transcriptional regulator [Streptomyces sp. SID13031]